MDKLNQIVFWIATGLLTLLMLFSASMYIFNHDMIVGAFKSLGYPTYLIYPLATAKILGLIAIISNKSRTLKEWAYAGFFFDVVLAFTAHLQAEDGGYLLAAIGIVLVLISYIYDKKLGRDKLAL